MPKTSKKLKNKEKVDLAFKRSKDADEKQVIERASQVISEKYIKENAGQYPVNSFKDLIYYEPFLRQFKIDMIHEGHKYPLKSIKRRIFINIIRKIDNMHKLDGGMINKYLEKDEHLIDPRLENHVSAVRYTHGNRNTLELLLAMHKQLQTKILDLVDQGHPLAEVLQALQDQVKTRAGAREDDDDYIPPKKDDNNKDKKNKNANIYDENSSQFLQSLIHNNANNNTNAINSLDNSMKGIEIMHDYYNNIPMKKSLNSNDLKKARESKRERAIKKRIDKNKEERKKLIEQGYIIPEPKDEEPIPGDSDYSATDEEGGYKKGYVYPSGKHWTAIVKDLIKQNNFKGSWKDAVENLYKPYIYSNKKATKLIEHPQKIKKTSKKDASNMQNFIVKPSTKTKGGSFIDTALKVLPTIITAATLGKTAYEAFR